MRRSIRGALGLAAGAIAIAAVPALGLAGVASAASGDSGESADTTTRPARPALTDTQRQCLADHGVTPPTRPADGTHTPPTDEQRAAMQAAAEACGLPARPAGPGMGRGMGPQLTDDQRACLAAQGVTLPNRSTDGTRTPPTDEQRAAMKAAAEACGLPAPPDRPAGVPGDLSAHTTAARLVA
ncbi:MAG TPA: hypothetical protein VFZ17_04975 [Acidimicrobiia bacterium]|nr:hypothetical protein [Acidimicrobiia bacterium]